jgi:phosphatidylserine/phosphatidylglycerophosphate/cardiolipin synthase-like enzyme
MTARAVRLTLFAVLLALPATESFAQCTRPDRWSLSDVAFDILHQIESNSIAQTYSPVPVSRILSTCNRFVSVRVEGPAIFEAARDIIALADREVNIAFYKWEPGSNGARLIGDGLIAAQWRRSYWDPLLVRIVIDDVDNTFSPERAINHIYDSQKNWASRGLDLSRVQIQLATSPRETAASPALHDKIITVDSRYALVTGAQPQGYSDPFTPSYDSAWHDTGYVVEGDAAQSAVDAFEHTWLGDAIHWDCRPRDFDFDCQKRGKYPQPYRWWLPAFGSQNPGNVPILAVGRTKGSIFDNDTDNPQAIAWLSAMDRATWNISIETPNINDDAFQEAVKRAVARGVTVRLITSLGFNDATEDVIGLGGDNMEIVGRLRQAIRASTPWYQDRFQLRFYSRDGIEPVLENGSFASHTKYLTMDNRVAIVGSGNQDTASWNVIHEFNYLLDDASVTSQLQGTVFEPDWSRAITQYLELYEGNNATQDVVCPIAVHQNKTLRFYEPPLDGTDYRCDNDEARSILLHDIPAGRVFRFYDDPDRRYQDDDWTEIVVKRPVSRKYLSTFEQSFEDDDIRVMYHRNNGLDGKISSFEAQSAPFGPIMDLYEGNNGSQNLVCSNVVTGPRTIDLTQDAHCNNDEARSMVLYDFPVDKVIFVYDHSGGSHGDDWTLIVPKRTIKYAVINTFQSSFENADMRVCHFPDNGLDGKVSRIRIGNRSEAVGYCGVTATVSCPEGNCIPAQGTYVSHFSAPNCGGTESYYLPYDGYAYQCRTWNGTGACGTIQRTVTNYSARINNGPCQNLWPEGNTLTQFVTVYRGGGCGEASCVPSQGMYVSHFSAPGCTGTESYYLPYDGYAYQCRSWDGGGQCGTIQRTVTNYSARINGGACQDLWPGGNTLTQFVTIYR